MSSIFLAAGSGITPVFSLLKNLLFNYHKRVYLIYQNRSEEESIFRSELLLLQKQFSQRFIFIELFSAPQSHILFTKRLNNSLLEKLLLEALQTKDQKFYLCGPNSFMRMAQFTLRLMQHPVESIVRENFFAVPPPPPFVVHQQPHTVNIYYQQHNYKLEVAYPNTILDVALKHNIQLPYSCRGGRCSTCIARCVSGNVKMSINDILTDKDLQNGMILTCVAYPESDVEITYH